MPLDLNKSVEVARKEAGLNLIKQGQKVGLTRADMRSQVVAVFDVSGSTQDLYRKKIMQALATRALGLALVVDDNGSVPAYALDNGVHRISTELTVQNLDNFVKDHIVPLVGGGTNYAPTLQAILEDLKAGDPMYVLFLTDGQNYDEGPSEEAIKALSFNPVFFQFFGVYEDGRAPAFPFLEKLNNLSGRNIDNAGFCTVDVSKISDDELYAAMMNEYPQFLVEARKRGMLPWTKVVHPQRGGGGLGRLFGGR